MHEPCATKRSQGRRDVGGNCDGVLGRQHTRRIEQAAELAPGHMARDQGEAAAMRHDIEELNNLRAVDGGKAKGLFLQSTPLALAALVMVQLDADAPPESRIER